MEQEIKKMLDPDSPPRKEPEASLREACEALFRAHANVVSAHYRDGGDAERAVKRVFDAAVLLREKLT